MIFENKKFNPFFRRRRERQQSQNTNPAASQEPKKSLILVSLASNEVRVAFLENGILEDFYIERMDVERMLGNIYKGKVKSFISGIGAAFVEMGTYKDGFLYVADALKSPLEEDEDNLGLRFSERHFQIGDMKIENYLKIGQEIVVQIVKEPIRNKGARLTTKFTIPARYLVLMPGESKIGISRRIEDRKERERLRGVFANCELPKDAGFILRTACEGKSETELQRDIRYLTRQWAEIKNRIQRSRGATLIHKELDLVERIIRDMVTENVRIVVDDKEVMGQIKKFQKIYLEDTVIPLDLYQGSKTLFEEYNIDKDVEKIFQKKVSLNCGGSIVIEQTEGMVSIDVNTGKFSGRRNLEETAFKTNCEAALEVAKQIRLRDLGGIIIIDFIDMEIDRHSREVVRVFREAVRKDHARTNVLQISELGLVEMTRQRVRPSLESTVNETCPHCEGKGVVKSVRTVVIDVISKIKRAVQNCKDKYLQVSVHPDVAERLMKYDQKTIQNVERATGIKILIVADSSLHVEETSLDPVSAQTNGV